MTVQIAGSVHLLCTCECAQGFFVFFWGGGGGGGAHTLPPTLFSALHPHRQYCTMVMSLVPTYFRVHPECVD